MTTKLIHRKYRRSEFIYAAVWARTFDITLKNTGVTFDGQYKDRKSQTSFASPGIAFTPPFVLAQRKTSDYALTQSSRTSHVEDVSTELYI
ncbi:hypothetical protein NQZ79_g6892 [Umbelopsis isabellina]|nr:hypothetical protein NQZ79_g6892 [Umbelopsis isabellina]